MNDDLWFRIIEYYSRIDLTFQKDPLPALSGLAKAYHARVFDVLSDSKFQNYVAGCWKHQLLLSLLWRSQKRRFTR
jgi:hypothetical protein